MIKAGYKNAFRGTASVKVGLNEEGFIAEEGVTPTSYKTFNFTVTNANNTLTENESFTNLFIGWVGGVPDNSTQKFKVTWEV